MYEVLENVDGDARLLPQLPGKLVGGRNAVRRRHQGIMGGGSAATVVASLLPVAQAMIDETLKQ